MASPATNAAAWSERLSEDADGPTLLAKRCQALSTPEVSTGFASNRERLDLLQTARHSAAWRRGCLPDLAPFCVKRCSERGSSRRRVVGVASVWRGREVACPKCRFARCVPPCEAGRRRHGVGTTASLNGCGCGPRGDRAVCRDGGHARLGGSVRRGAQAAPEEVPCLSGGACCRRCRPCPWWAQGPW